MEESILSKISSEEPQEGNMIDKITIKVGTKTVELTLEEARVLKGELNSLLGDTQFIPYYPYYPQPYTPPQQPWVTWTDGTAGTITA